MGETFWGAVVSGGVAIIVCLITQLSTKSLIAYRIGELEKKVDAHNKLIERTYRLEERTEIQEEKIKVANHRIDDLEKERSHA